MTNSYFNYTSSIARFTTADVQRINSSFKAIEAGFDKLPSATELTQGSRNYSVATYANGAYSVTLPFNIVGYNQGLQVAFLAPVSNPTGATLNINGIGPMPLKRFDGSNILASDIRATSLNSVIFDGTSFRLISMHGGIETLAATSATSAAASSASAATSATNAASSAASAATSATTASTAASTATSVLSGTRLGLRNVLLNNQFWVSQWMGSTLSATVGAGVYVRDRWKSGSSGLTFSIANNIMTITAGSVQQIVQGRNLIPGGIYTLSWSGNAIGKVNGTTISNGGQVSLPGATNAVVEFSAGSFSVAQLEHSPIKTPVEFRPHDLELMLCYQYFQKSYAHLTNPGSATTINQNIILSLNENHFVESNTPFPIKMRAVPVVTVYSPTTGTVNKVYSAGISAPSERTIIVQSVKEDGFFMTSPANLAFVNHYLFHWTADAEL